MTRAHRWLPSIAALILAAGCSSAPAPESAAPPPSEPPPGSAAVRPGESQPTLISGASDSVGSIPGSAGALYIYRFRQIDPASDRFNFRDRDLSFAFRPSPSALYFQVENLQGRPVWIDWERSKFLDPFGRLGDVAHSTTRWQQRFGTQAQTQIPGLQRYSDYAFPLDYLIDSADSQDEQPRRTLLPEDQSAPTFTDRTFGVDLTFLIEGQPRVYSFRFKVASVIPR